MNSESTSAFFCACLWLNSGSTCEALCLLLNSGSTSCWCVWVDDALSCAFGLGVGVSSFVALPSALSFWFGVVASDFSTDFVAWSSVVFSLVVLTSCCTWLADCSVSTVASFVCFSSVLSCDVCVVSFSDVSLCKLVGVASCWLSFCASTLSLRSFNSLDWFVCSFLTSFPCCSPIDCACCASESTFPLSWFSAAWAEPPPINNNAAIKMEDVPTLNLRILYLFSLFFIFGTSILFYF